MNNITDNDKGFKRLLALIKEKVKITIGIHEAEGSASHGEATVAEIGAIHEYGWKAKNIPRRSFVRDTHDTKLQENLALLVKLEDDVIAGKRTQDQALKTLGEVAAKQMVSRINDGIAPRNAPATIRRKKSSKPLIDTGQLKGAITFQVKELS
jgi:phage gpG-like protein